MKTTNRFALLITTVLGLSACAPMTPAPDGSYTPPPAQPQEPVPPITQPDPVPQQKYVVQLTASSSQTKAEGIKNTFAARGYNAFVSPLMVNGRLLHRVQIGYYSNQADAQTTLSQLRQQYPTDIYVSEAVVKTP